MIPNKLIKIAKKHAVKSKHKQKMAAIIWKGKRLISIGYNHPCKSVHSITKEFIRYPNSIHAEIEAIIKAKTDLKRCNMLVIRVRPNGELGLAKPCRHCLSYLMYVGITNLYYSNNDGEIENEKL